MTFPAAMEKKERLKTCTTKRLISIGSRSALYFRCLATLGAATAEEERLRLPIKQNDAQSMENIKCSDIFKIQQWSKSTSPSKQQPIKEQLATLNSKLRPVAKFKHKQPPETGCK